MKKQLVILLSVITFLFSSSPVLADDEVRNLTVDLKAKGFTQSLFVDELKSTDINFGPNDKYQLQLRITNSGNRNQTNIKVRQIIPTFVVTDSNREFTIPQIASGDTYTKNLVVTVKDKQFVYSKLTRGQITVNAVSEIGTNSEDSLAFYVGNGTYSPQTSTSSAKILPKTGSTNLIVGTIFAISLLGVSLYLRRLARGY
ncbi:MAG: CARDB domain-containing protein [Candidatus Shapirobacteria bacterium]